MDTKNIRVLLLEDEAAHAEAIRRALKSSSTHYQVKLVGTLKEYRDSVAAGLPDIALLDMALPDGGALELLGPSPEANPFPLLIMTSHGDEQTAVEAMKAGALDYVVKSPQTFADMPRIVTHALDHWELLQERRQALEALRESEERYRSILEQMDEVYYEVDLAGNFTFLNEYSCRKLGYSREELMGKSFALTVPEDDVKTLFAASKAVFKSGEPNKCFGHSILRKDGSVLFAESFIGIRRNKQGDIIGFKTVSRDITGRKQAGDALQKSEEKYRSLVENINDVFYTLDTRGTITYVSPVVERFTLYKVNDLIGKPFIPLIYPDDLPGLLDSLNRLVSGQLEPWEFRILDKDGRVIFVRTSSKPVYENGEVIGITALMTDVTERKQTEDARKDSEEKYRLLVENAREAIFIAVDGMIKFANSRTTVISGYSPEEIISRPFIDFIHPDDRRMVAERYIKWLNGEEVPTTDTVRFIFKPGNIIWGELNVVSITWEGRPAVLGFLTDVTDRKRLEEEQQRVDKLEAVGLLAGGIAHDFNNILTAILGNISLAGMEATPGSELQNSLEQAEKAVQRARALTVQLLTFSKGGAPILKLASLTELMKDTAGFALSGSNVKCKFSIPAGLWHAEIDAGQVSQVIHNLVINAQQAMPAGGSIEIIAENISLSETQSLGRGLPLDTGDYVRISVTDHGIGIPKDHLEKIFDPFFTTKQKGNGMGLAVSFSIARQHGGHLSVESELGTGSTFYLYLPASLQKSALEKDRQEQIKPAGKARILVMDDEVGVRDIAGRLLKHIGYQDVEFAEDGAEAIKLYKAAMKEGKPFSVAILDLTIAGGMGGEVAIQKLLKIDPGVKAIVSSGYVDDPAMARFRNYGFSGVVAKPYSIAELRKAVQDVIGGA